MELKVTDAVVGVAEETWERGVEVGESWVPEGLEEANARVQGKEHHQGKR